MHLFPLQELQLQLEHMHSLVQVKEEEASKLKLAVEELSSQKSKIEEKASSHESGVRASVVEPKC